MYNTEISLQPELTSNESIPSMLSLADNRIQIDTINRLVSVESMQTPLNSPLAYNVLVTLAETPDEPVSRSTISERVWQWEDYHFYSKTLDVTISHLRKRLGRELGHVKTGAIQTVRGIGYMALSTIS